jgi:uncharacterized membrane protein YeaQ/YmgE (transglycosylase-associated protein family)
MVNYIAVLVASVVSFFVGFLWYSPALFGKVWLKLMGIKNEPSKEGMYKKMVIGFVGTLVTAYVLANLATMLGYVSAMSGATLGALVWVGFVGTVTLNGVLWENKPWSLWVLNNGHSLVGLLLMGAILGAWV